MFTRSSTTHRTVRMIAGAALALAVSLQGALAQTAAPPVNKPVTKPKQVGTWAITGWSQGYCAAERPVPGAAADGATLQFLVARVRIGYRLALSAPDWELTPQTSFPIELIADPVWRSDATALAVGPKLIIIELGASGAFMKKLATAPMIEVKAAQASFKLPLESFENAVAELDACFESLRKPASNPFAAPARKTAQNSGR